jgi:hypothetical protein
MLNSNTFKAVHYLAGKGQLFLCADYNFVALNKK